jgi:hypothetical protein
MSDLRTIHFLKISGMIAENRKPEFENMVKYACGLMPEECLEKTLSVEVSEENNYYFFSEWSTGQSLKKFIQSEEYKLIRSAYDVLGVLHKIEIGYHVEIKTIRIHH